MVRRKKLMERSTRTRFMVFDLHDLLVIIACTI